MKNIVTTFLMIVGTLATPVMAEPVVTTPSVVVNFNAEGEAVSANGSMNLAANSGSPLGDQVVSFSMDVFSLGPDDHYQAIGIVMANGPDAYFECYIDSNRPQYENIKAALAHAGPHARIYATRDISTNLCKTVNVQNISALILTGTRE